MTELINKQQRPDLDGPLEMVRPQRLAENVVFVDGFSGSGKSLIAPILSSLERSELWRLDHNFEFQCTLDHFGQIDRRAAAMMIQLEADLELYNLMIGRNTNFREGDDSGVAANLQVERYRQRLFEKDGDRVTRLIQETRPILYIMTHEIFPMSELLWDALREPLRLFIVFVRHPFWQIQGWFEGNWEQRVGHDPRDFQPCYRRNGHVFPWYASGWEEEYLRLSGLERAIRHVASYIRGCEEFLSLLPANAQRRVLIVPFEPFTTDPRPYLRQLTTCLKTRVTELTSKILEKVNIPRQYAEGYLATKRQEFDRLVKRERVSEKYATMAYQLSAEYESKYLTRWPV